MAISATAWVNYVRALSAIDKAATNQMAEFINNFKLFGAESFSYDNPKHMQALIGYAYGLSTAYGEGAAALACEMYDLAGLASGLFLEPAIPVDPASPKDVAAAIVEAAGHKSTEVVASKVGAIVKRTGALTTVTNAKRDNLKVAWIPHGDTCAFCITLASRGWEDASYAVQDMHIHSNCDCAYGVKYTDNTKYKGYDPEEYKKIYYDAPLREGESPTSKARINALRREAYRKNKEEINAQKRANYEKRRELESSKAEEIDVN